MSNTSDICETVVQLRKEIESFVKGHLNISDEEAKEKLQEIKNCERLFKEASVDEDSYSVKCGLNAIKNAFLVSLKELEEKGLFKATASVQHNVNKPGRPEKIVDVQKVKSMGKTGMQLTNIAKSLGVSYSKLYSSVKKNTGDAPTKMIYSTLSDTDLDEKLNHFEEEHGRHGRRMTEGFLRAEGIILPNAKTRIKDSNYRRQLEPLQIGHRLKRRTYRARGPASLCHIDTHHKLGRKYGVVIHAAVDGFSKLCIYCRASNKNDSTTALNFFLAGCQRSIFPSRVRTDKGTENVKIWNYMNELRGSAHKPVLKGPSTNNTRIERFWGYLTQGSVVKKYRDVFNKMEESGLLDMDNENELFLLHLVYLPRIDKELKDFTEWYNNHRIEGHGIPKEVFLRGCYEKYGIESPRLQDEINVAEFDILPNDIEDNEEADSVRREEHEPVVRDVFLSCSERQKQTLKEKIRERFGEIDCYNPNNAFCCLSNIEAESAFLQCKNILNDVLLDLE